jgi:hypothetical protein
MQEVLVRISPITQRMSAGTHSRCSANQVVSTGSEILLIVLVGTVRTNTRKNGIDGPTMVRGSEAMTYGVRYPGASSDIPYCLYNDLSRERGLLSFGWCKRRKGNRSSCSLRVPSRCMPTAGAWRSGEGQSRRESAILG